jgi:hypothetical protein
MRVRAGETVEIVLHADEPDNLGVWQTGVNRIELLNPDGDREERIISRGGPRTCGDKVREGEATFTYRVPRDAQPGRTLDFVVDAYDWANNRLSRSLTLIVEEEVWEGTWRGTEETFVPPGGGRFVRSNTALDGTFTFRVSPDNTIRGEAMATVAYQLESGEFCTTRINLPPTMIALEVHGRRAGEQFELELRPRAGAALRYTRVDRCPPDAPPETSEPNWLDEGFLGAIGRATMPARDGAEMEFPVTTIPEQTVRYRVTLRQRR